MSMQWFRMYAEFATDPKVQMLSEVDQRRFIMLLCMRCSNGSETLHETLHETPHAGLQDEVVMFQLRISAEEWQATKATLLAIGLITEDNMPAAWDKRQFTADSSTARVRAHRARKKKEVKRACNVTVTPPEAETDTDTDTEVERESAHSAVGAKCKTKPKTPGPGKVQDASQKRFVMPDGWQPDPEILQTLMRRQTSVKPADVTTELIDKYRLWCIDKGRQETSHGWHTGLMRWAINERKPVAAGAMRQAAGAGLAPDDTSWIEGIEGDLF